jgi:hypothetical protein
LHSTRHDDEVADFVSGSVHTCSSCQQSGSNSCIITYNWMHCIMKVDEMVGTLVFMGELRNIYYIFVRKLDRKKSLRRTQHKYS